MKILQVINNMDAGGAQKLLLETIPLYIEQGINMDILILDGTNHPFMQALSSLKFGQIYTLSNGSVYNPFHILKIIPFLKKYQLVHVHLFPAQYWTVLAKWLSFSTTRLIFTEHNTTNRRMENKLFHLSDRIIYKGYKKLICITQPVKEILQKHTGLSENRFVVIENGVNLSRIKQATAYKKTDIHPDLKEEDILLIQVAEFREQKDQLTLIKAMPLLPDNYKLLLVGEGQKKAACVQLARELNIADQVFFLGVRMDVPELLKSADIVVLSSKYEGFSLASVEGMASGKPLIASDVLVLSEVVGGAGVLFELGNEKDLASKIKYLMENPVYYETIANACQKRAALYDINHMVTAHIKLYKELIDTSA